MKNLMHRIMTIVVVTAVQISQSDGFSDPVASLCSPLCREETTLEEQCATARGCYGLDEKGDADRYLACWKPCWDVAGKCFSLCAEEFDDLLQRCYNVCTSTPDDITCISSCFDQCFLKLKHDVLDDAINFTLANLTTSSASSTLSPVSATVASFTETGVMRGQVSPTIDPATIDQIVENVEVYRSERDNRDISLRRWELDALLAYLYLNLVHNQPTEKTFKSDHSHQHALQYLNLNTSGDALPSMSTESPKQPTTTKTVARATDTHVVINPFLRHNNLKHKQVAVKKNFPTTTTLTSIVGKLIRNEPWLTQDSVVKSELSPPSQSSGVSNLLTRDSPSDIGRSDKDVDQHVVTAEKHDRRRQSVVRTDDTNMNIL